MNPDPRPNLLLITSDQHRGDCYGFAGRAIQTPHLDRLAADGAYFSACITPNVVCQPSRASILTGLLPLTHGVHDNGIDLDPMIGERGFAGALGHAGYTTGFIGKAHFATFHTFAPTGTPECLRSSADYGPDWYGPYMGFERAELMLVGHNWWPPERPPAGQHYERWYHADGRGEEKTALYRDNAGETWGAVQTWHSRLPPAWHNSTWTADRTIAFIDQHAAAKTRQPFCLWASFPDPHHPFDAPLPWSLLHHPDAVDLPAHRERDFDRRPWWHAAAIGNEPAGDPAGAEVRKSYSRIPPQNDRQLRALIANYYGMIALIDHNVGRILAALDAAGIAGNTLVVFTSDHGDWLGDHGLILKGPMHYEGLLRVGCLLRGPGVPAGKVIAEPVSTLDLPATLLDYADAAASGHTHSRSLRPLLEGGSDATRDFAYNEWELHPQRAGVALSLRTVRTKTHKLTVDLQSRAGELYDLGEDPHEMHNRFDDPACAAARRELQDMIASRPDDAGPTREPVGMA